MRQISWFRRASGLLGLPALLASCTSLAPHEPSLPAGAVAVAAPAIYRDWHQKTQACSGLGGEFSTIQFYVVPGVETFPTQVGAKVGLWNREGGINRIVIAGNYLSHEMVVRHEMLHALLQREGHPTNYFIERCRLTWDSWNSEVSD
jgi:hypothetical protein